MARLTVTGSRRIAGQRGVAFLAVLLMIAAMGASLAVGATFWQHVRQRDKESELLFVGMQISRAIGRYYENSPGAKRYPPALDALLLDPRAPAVRRYLRRPWRDPLTDAPVWGLLMAPEGGIMGVYSLGGGEPIKQAGFPEELGWERAPASYADWQFVFRPGVRKQ